MSKVKEFSLPVIEKLGYYVYFLTDPETDKIFYVGKGNGNRVFAHLNLALSSPQASDKLDEIRLIQSKGLHVNHVIHRHGLTEKEAFEVEASLIDFIGLENLTNIANGHHSDYHGRMNIQEVIGRYGPPIEIGEPAILITVNRLFRRGMSDDELYEITRGNWVVGKRKDKAKFAFCVYNGVVQKVYKIQEWFQAEARRPEAKTQNRWRFEGAIAEDLEHYIGGSVENYVGAQNPIKYVNC